MFSQNQWDKNLETSGSSLQLEEQGKSMGGRVNLSGSDVRVLFVCLLVSLKRTSIENCYRSDINDIFFSDKLWSDVLYFQRSSVWVKEQLKNGMLRALCEYFGRCNQDKYQPLRCYFISHYCGGMVRFVAFRSWS